MNANQLPILLCIALAWACGSSDVSLGKQRPFTLTLTTEGTGTQARVGVGPDAGASTVLMPVLAFHGTRKFVFAEPQLEGSLPGDFKLHLSDPPPDDAFIGPPVNFPNESRLALGYLAATDTDLPTMVELGGLIAPTWTLCDGCELECSLSRWCTKDEAHCYEEEECCSTNGPACCEVARAMGDPSVKDPWTLLEGAVEHYVVAYLEKSVSSNTRAAHFLGSSSGLAQGYHLLHIRRPTPAEETEQLICLQHAAELALERYNAAQGTKYSQADIDSDICGGSPCSDALFDELGRLADIACLELDCLAGGAKFVFTPVLNPEDERLTLRLDPDAVPVDHPAFSASRDSCM